MRKTRLLFVMSWNETSLLEYTLDDWAGKGIKAHLGIPTWAKLPSLAGVSVSWSSDLTFTPHGSLLANYPLIINLYLHAVLYA